MQERSTFPKLGWVVFSWGIVCRVVMIETFGMEDIFTKAEIYSGVIFSH
jgi:hypothetical protein